MTNFQKERKTSKQTNKETEPFFFFFLPSFFFKKKLLSIPYKKHYGEIHCITLFTCTDSEIIIKNMFLRNTTLDVKHDYITACITRGLV